MSTLRLELKSSVVENETAVVNISLNGVLLDENKQLTEEPSISEYLVLILLDSPNTLSIEVLNDAAHDTDGDGDYIGYNETRRAILTRLEYSIDNTSYTTVIPQPKVEKTITEGVHAGNTIVLRDQINYLESYGLGYDFKFDNYGLMNNIHANTNWYQGFYLKEINGVFYDSDEKPVSD